MTEEKLRKLKKKRVNVDKEHFDLFEWERDSFKRILDTAISAIESKDLVKYESAVETLGHCNLIQEGEL